MGVAYDWTTMTAPGTAGLFGVESHDEVAFAAGDRGLLLERLGPGDWTPLIRDGPTGNGTNLNAAALTDEGERLWYCGDSGAFGYYDRVADEPVPHTAPEDMSNGFLSISVRGVAGAETVHVVDDAGQVVRARADGDEVSVADTAILGDGSTLTEVIEGPDGLFVSDASGYVFQDSGVGDWRGRQLVDTTIEGLSVAATGVAAVTDEGDIYRDLSLTDDERMQRADLGDESPEDITAVGQRFAVVGDDGLVVVIGEAGRVTKQVPGPGGMLYGVELMDDGTLLAVGSDGTVLEGTPQSQ